MKEETQIRLWGLSAESTFARAERKLKGQGERTNLQIKIKKKIQAKEKREREKWHKWLTRNSMFICEKSPGCDERQKPTPHMPRCSTPFSYNRNKLKKKIFSSVYHLWVWGVFRCATEHMWNSEDNSWESALYLMELRIDLKLSGLYISRRVLYVYL